MTLPLIAPAILAGGLLAFALSVDDFVITYFNAGPEVTFPLFVWGAARVGAPPQVNVIGTVDLRRRRRGDARQRPRPDAERDRNDRTDARRPARSSSSRPPATTSGCTSRAWAATATPRCRSSSAATGCYLEDSNGKRYLDALAGLFSVNIGYGYGEEIGQAALEQMRELPFYTNWSYAHPRAIELAGEVASLAPGDLNRVFFVSGGSEAVESAWKLARQYYAARGEKRLRSAVTPGGRAGATEPEVIHDAIVAAARPAATKAIARHVAYHGTTMGALSINGIPAIRAPFEPLVPEVRHVRNTNRYHRPLEETEEEFTAFLLDDLEQAILAMGPETVCLVHMEPVQNAGGAFTPPAGYWRGVREICDRYDILLSADEVITGFGRLGHWFGSERYDIRPDIVTCAKGLSSSYASIGAVIATDSVMEPFLDGSTHVHARDHLRRPPGPCARSR